MKTGKSSIFFAFVFVATCAHFALADDDIAPIMHARDTQLCDLTNCWKQVFPRITSTVSDAAQALDAYQTQFSEKMSEVEWISTGTGDTKSDETKSLALQLTTLDQYLGECQDLMDGPAKHRHLILIGHTLDRDGGIFELAAQTQYQEILRKTCGSENESAGYAACKRGIVIKHGMDKNDFLEYIRFLAPGSVKSITYIGHGIPNGLVMGKKDLLLPVNWSPDLKIDQSQWQRLNQGMLYSSDLTDSRMGKEFARVMAPGADIKFYACDTGREFAPTVKRVASQASVEASTIPMHFVYQKPDGNWSVGLKTRIPSDATQVKLVPDQGTKYFGAVKMLHATAPLNSEFFAKAPLSPKETRDQATHDIILKLALGSSDHALVDHGGEFLVFSPQDRKTLRGLLGSRLQHNQLVGINYQTFESLLDRNPTPESRLLKRKIQDCIRESVRLYYPSH